MRLRINAKLLKIALLRGDSNMFARHKFFVVKATQYEKGDKTRGIFAGISHDKQSKLFLFVIALDSKQTAIFLEFLKNVFAICAICIKNVHSTRSDVMTKNGSAVQPVHYVQGIFHQPRKNLYKTSMTL